MNATPLCSTRFPLQIAELSSPAPVPAPALADLEPIPACPRCEGDGCGCCLGTGLTREDFDFFGLSRALSRAESF